MNQTYSRYLHLQELLAQQCPLSDGPEHDEMLFIVIHQVYELWFKQILHEVDYLFDAFEAADTPRVLHTFKRILTILKTLVVQVDVLETMTPLSFLSFRHRLQASSGFQSAQFRELESVLGRRDEAMLRAFAPGSEEEQKVRARMEQPNLYESFLGYLASCGQPIPADVLQARPLAPTASPAVQQVLVAIYRGEPILAQVCERMVDLDEGVQEWRYRHMKMVERTIGTKTGTGGSSGVEYLRSTLLRPSFPDLWAIRAML